MKHLLLQAIALTGINILAFVYDNTYIPIAIGIDALVLGIDVHSIYQIDVNKKKG